MARVLLVLASLLLVGGATLAAVPTAAADPWVDCVVGGGRIYLPSGSCCPRDAVCWDPDAILDEIA